MRDKILDIIRSHPKRYTHIIKNDEEMCDWISKNKKTNNDKFSAQIYSSVYDISDKCINNNIKKFDRWSTGFIGCGPASTCLCTRNNISNSVTLTKQSISVSEKEKSNDKRKNTMISKYGVEYNSQRPEVKDILSISKLPNNIVNILNDYDWLYEQYENKKRTSVDIANEIGIYYGTVIEYLKKYNFDIRKTSSYSLEELQIKEYIKNELGITIVENDRTILDGKELDILIPQKNIAIEHNGLYWHSYGKYDKENPTYHINKKEKCLEKGINLIFITDYEWKNKCDIVKSIIKSKLGLNKKIYARKCKIAEVSTPDAKAFFNKTHLNGFIGASKYIGLMYNDSLVMCMSFGKHRFKDGIELYRMSSELGMTVVGGGSKILKYYTDTYNINHIYSYCDFAYSNGNGYENIGFKLTGKSKPNYFWTDRKNIISRYKTRHSTNLMKFVGDNYDSELSEKENMLNAGYRIYWGCGNLIYEYTNDRNYKK